MEAQKILSKGKAPATQEDINNVLNQIREILLTYPDYMISKADTLYLAIRDKIDEVTEKGIMNDIDARNTIRTHFYQTFAADFKKDEFDDNGHLKITRKSRMWYLNYLHTRMIQMNSGEYFDKMYQNEVKRIIDDFNQATNIIITKYKEYNEINSDVLPYERSELKHQIDLIINQTSDSFRLYERNLEDYNIKSYTFEYPTSPESEKYQKAREMFMKNIK